MTSSLVQQKWTSSARPRSSSPGAIAARRRLRKYSTALTSCTRLPLDRRELVDLAGAEVGDDLRAGAACSSSVSAADARDDLVVGEVDQPLDLDVDPLAVERRLGQVVDEGRDRTAVAAVEGAQRNGRGRVSKRSHDPQSPRVRGHLTDTGMPRADAPARVPDARHTVRDMRYTTLGSSGTVVSTQCLGTMTFGAEADEATSGAILEAFVEAGGNFIDTADVYSKRRLRGDHRPLAQGPPRGREEPRRRHQGPLRDGRRRRTTSACRAGTCAAPSTTRCAASASSTSTSTRCTPGTR